MIVTPVWIRRRLGPVMSLKIGARTIFHNAVIISQYGILPTMREKNVHTLLK
jgi:hypothetical protein